MMGWVGQDGWGMWHVWQRRKFIYDSDQEALMERHHSEYISVDGREILKWVSKKHDAMARNGLILFKTATSDGHISLHLSLRIKVNINLR